MTAGATRGPLCGTVYIVTLGAFADTPLPVS
jgi:hypothetical protein